MRRPYCIFVWKTEPSPAVRGSAFMSVGCHIWILVLFFSSMKTIHQGDDWTLDIDHSSNDEMNWTVIVKWKHGCKDQWGLGTPGVRVWLTKRISKDCFDWVCSSKRTEAVRLPCRYTVQIKPNRSVAFMTAILIGYVGWKGISGLISWAPILNCG